MVVGIWITIEVQKTNRTSLFYWLLFYLPFVSGLRGGSDFDLNTFHISMVTFNFSDPGCCRLTCLVVLFVFTKQSLLFVLSM